MDMGCARLCLGEVKRAEADLTEAEKLYRAHIVNGKAVDWAIEMADKANELMNAIHNGTYSELVDRWFKESLTYLGLDESGRKITRSKAREG